MQLVQHYIDGKCRKWGWIQVDLTPKPAFPLPTVLLTIMWVESKNYTVISDKPLNFSEATSP